MNAFAHVQDVDVMRQAVSALVGAVTRFQGARYELSSGEALGDLADLHDVMTDWLDQARERLGELLSGGGA